MHGVLPGVTLVPVTPVYIVNSASQSAIQNTPRPLCTLCSLGRRNSREDGIEIAKFGSCQASALYLGGDNFKPTLTPGDLTLCKIANALIDT
jgi:hypothetical protein